ncbi:MAG TPA: universal stress protein [Candidatus Tectomicrobia bacterium]
MFKHILVPVDLSDRHQHALEVAAYLARESHGEVALLHVIEITPGPWPQERDCYKRIAELAHHHLTSLGRSLEADQVLGRQEIVYGNRAHEIVCYALEAGIDLIVLTSRRIDPNDPNAGWGPVSHQVGMLSQCPVLLVK